MEAKQVEIVKPDSGGVVGRTPQLTGDSGEGHTNVSQGHTNISQSFQEGKKSWDLVDFNNDTSIIIQPQLLSPRLGNMIIKDQSEQFNFKQDYQTQELVESNDIPSPVELELKR